MQHQSLNSSHNTQNIAQIHKSFKVIKFKVSFKIVFVHSAFQRASITIKTTQITDSDRQTVT